MAQQGSSLIRHILYTHGYIAKMVGRVEAELYFTRLLQFDERNLRPEFLASWGVFFTIHPAVQHVPPSTVIANRPAWLLDYGFRNCGPVIPQKIWTAGDSGRFCNVSLNMPIFFLHRERGTPGLRVARTAAGNDLAGIMSGGAPAPVGNGSWTSIRINWPGYEEWSRQIRTRDQSQAQNTITFETLAASVARAVCKSLETFEKQSCDQPTWRVGCQNGITADHIILIGLIHVSQGSWQPILQLDHHIPVIPPNKLESQ